MPPASAAGATHDTLAGYALQPRISPVRTARWYGSGTVRIKTRTMATPIHFRYHRPGKDTKVYEEVLVLDRPDVKVLLQDQYSGTDVDVAGSRILDSGAPIIWFIFVGSWYDIGRFHRTDGTFTGWYTNLATPVEFNGDNWIGHDLFLDLWQPVVGDAVWLDQDEFAAAVETHLIDAATRRRVLNERALIDLQVSRNAWPPAIAWDIGLEQVRSLTED